MDRLNETQLRAQAVMYKENYSYSVIAQKLDHSKAWVSKWVSRWKVNRTETLRNRMQLKRKSALTAAAQRKVRTCKYKRGHSRRKLERLLKTKQLSGSRESIRRYLWYSLKWRCFKHQTIPRLTSDYKTRRINFAKKYKDIDWSTVSLMNHHLTSIMHQTGKMTLCGVLQSTRCLVPNSQQVKFSPRVMVWGEITARGLTNLHIIPQTMNVNSDYYVQEILEKEVKPAFNRTQTSTDLTATKLFSRNS